MAEEVVFRGGDFESSILENAASEATLVRVAEALEAQQKGTAQKVLGMHTSAVNANIKAQEQQRTASDSYNDTLKKLNAQSNEVVNTFSKIIGMSIGTTFALMQSAGQGLLTFLKNGFDAFQQTAQVGASFNNNLIDLRKTAAGALIPLEDFTELIIQNSDTLAALGGSVTNGAKIFGDTARAFRDEYSEELIGAGYSLNQMNESVMAYLDLQTRLGKLDNRNINTITKGTKDYITELDQVTKLTGVSRKQAEELVKKAAMDPILNSMMRTAKDQAKAQANMAALAQVGGDQALEMIKSMAARNPSEEARLLMAQTGATMEEARNILTGGVGSAEALTKMKNYANQLEQQGMLTDEYAEIMAAHNPAMANLIRTMMQFQRMTPEQIDKIQKEQKARDAITSVFGNIAKVLNNIYNKFLIRLTESRTFIIFQEKLEALAQAFDDNAEGIENFIDKMFSVFTGVVDNFMNNVGREGIIAAVIDLFKDLFRGIKDQILPSAKTLLTNLWSSARSKTQDETTGERVSRALGPNAPAFTRVPGQPLSMNETPPATGEDFGFDLLGNIKEGIEAIVGLLPSFKDLGWWLGITGVGGAVGGIGLSVGLGAVARGLAELAIPALAVGAAIGLGGAGLAGAFWGFSKAVEAVNQGISTVKDFFTGMSNIDASKLKEVGAATGPLTASLLEMSAGGILALLGGGGLTSLSTSLTNLSSIDYSKLSGSGESLKSLHEGLASFTNSGVLSNWGESITSYFTGGTMDNFVASLQKFGEINLTNLANIQPLTDLLKGISVIADATAAERIPTAINTLQDSIGKINIDQAKIDSLTSATGSIKTAFDTNLASSTSNVDNFNNSVTKLIDSLSKLEEQMKKTSSVDSPMVGQVITENSNQTGSPVISSDDPQRQLNMKFDQMIELLTQMKDNTKDAADSLSNRRGAL